MNKPAAGDAARSNTYVYTITYADGDEDATVTLTEKPGTGPTEAGRWPRTCTHRARHLPDVSVEQMFLSGETTTPDGQEPVLHRPHHREAAGAGPGVSLDRLLRDETGKSLLAGATMTLATETIEAGRRA